MRKPGHVLIADDDTEWRRVFCNLAETAGVEYVAVSDWVGVYSQINQRKPARIILDLALEYSVRNGLSELKRLSTRSQVPTFVATAWIESSDAQECLEIEGVEGLLRKPKFFERLGDVCRFLGFEPSEQSLAAVQATSNLRLLAEHELSRRMEERNRVFVVHGRNSTLRTGMFEFLRALRLEPIEWGHAVDLSKDPASYVKHILDAALGSCGAVLVLLSGDDKVRLRGELCRPEDDKSETTFRYQARPNVFFELGLAMATTPGKVILVDAGKNKIFSDIEGMHRVRLNNSPEARNELAGRLSSAGCDVNTRGADWLKAGDLSAV